MLEMKYGSREDHDVITPGLADGEVATVHFKTPDLAKHGAGGWCGFSNDYNDSSDIVLSLTTEPDAFKAATVGQLSGSIRFVEKKPNLQDTSRYYVLESNTDYYIRVQSIGASPHGVKVKLYAAKEPRP